METQDELSLPQGFGAPSGSGAKFERFKLKAADDSMTLRPLPAMKGLLNKREPGIFIKLHYGWQGRNPSDPTKTAHRPFLCIEEKRSGMTVKECSACKLRDSYLKKLEAIKIREDQETDRVRGQAKTKGITDEGKIAAVLAKQLEPLRAEKEPVNKWLKDHGVDGKYNFYAMNKTGQIGIGMIPYGLKKKYSAEVKSMESRLYPASIAKGKEVPVQVNGRVGVYFNFVRVGKASNTSDSVVVNQVPFGDSGAVVTDWHTVSNAVLQQAQDVLPCLVEEQEALRISDEKVEALVKHCVDMGGGCDPDVVDSIMGSRVRSSAPSVTETKPVIKEEAADFMAETPAAKVETVVVPEVKVEVKAEVKPEPKAEVKAETVVAPAAVQNGADMADDQFDNLF
jgi:hypothetical protein